MFNQLYENIVIRERIEKKLASLREGKTWEQIALEFYQILDDIDTADDVCKVNAELFQEMVMKLQAKKNQLLYSPDGQTVKRVDECVCHIYEMDDDKLLEFYRGMDRGYRKEDGSRMKTFIPDKKEVEKELEKRGLDVKEYNKGVDEKLFYHVTNVDNIDLIEEEGLKADSYITDSLEDAEAMRDIMADEHETQTAIVKFSLTSEQVNKLTVDQNQPNAYETHEILRPVIESKLKVGGTFEWKTLDGSKYKGVIEEIDLNVLIVKLPDGTIKTVESSAKEIKENLTDFARNELQIAGLFDKDSDYDGMLGEATIELINTFAKQGHSGFSAGLVRELFSKLSNYKPLTEISNNPEEWNDVSEYSSREGKRCWQSKRSSSCFSNDEGKTYWDIDEDYFFHTDEDGTRWSGGLSKEEWDKRPMHTSKDYE